MAYGEHNANENQLVTQTEAIPGVLDTSQLPMLAIDINTDGNGYDDLQRFVEQSPDGIIALTGAALVAQEATVAGNFMPHYAMMPIRLTSIMGDPYSTTTLADGRVMRKWKMPEVGRRNIKPFSGFWGFGATAIALLYGKITQMNIDCARASEVSGNITTHYNNVKRAQTVPGYTPANKIVRIATVAATTDGVFTFPSTPLGAGGNVTVPRGAALSALQTAIRALPGYNDVGLVVGGAGVTASGGANEVQNISSAVPVVLDAKNGGSNQTITPGDTLTAIRDKIALNLFKATPADIVVTGTSTAASGVVAQIANPSAAPPTSSPQGSWGGASGNYLSAIAYGNAIGETLMSPTVSRTLTNGSTYPNVVAPSTIPSGVTFINHYMETTPGSGVFRLAGTLNSPTANAPIPATTAPAAGNKAPETTNTTASAGTGAVLNVNATFSGATVAAQPQTLMTSATGGATITRTTLGVAPTYTGSYDVTFGGAIGNAIIPEVVKVSGAEWTVNTTTQGSDGSGALVVNGGSYILPNQALCYKANDFADLATINMGNATTPSPVTDPHLIKTAQSHTFSMDNLSAAVYYEDRQLSAASHVDGTSDIEASITLTKDENGRCEELYATDNNGNSSVTAFYLRQAYRGGIDELWIDLYCGRNQKPSFPVEDNIAQRQFPLKRFFNRNGSCIFTTISAT